jgi:tRNA modification GTPase
VDTAGIRDQAGEVERIGIEVARRYLARADVVLLCCLADEGWGEIEKAFLGELPPGTPVIPVRTAVDRGRARHGALGAGGPEGAVESELEVSVVDGTGVQALRERLVGLAFRGIAALAAEVPVVTRRRQREGVEDALREVRSFAEALEGSIPAEVAAAHLRAAESAVEDLLGIISTEEVLDRVFTDFCIGK